MTLGRSTLIAPLLAAALLTPATPAGAAPFPDLIPLPNGFQPEGIATGRGPTAYVGSLRTGEIRRVDLRTGSQRTLESGDGTPAVGLEVDRQGRIFAAGGADGDAKVVDSTTGAVLARYDFVTAGETFVNDAVVHDGAAWFTDSRRPVLYRVPTSLDQGFTELPLSGSWVQTAGVNNANGIETTPDRSALLVVQSNTGLLHRVDPATGVATVVDLGGYVLTNGDGLLRDDDTLYVVQNRLNQVAVFTLAEDGTSGTFQKTITDPDFQVPTTVARFGEGLYLPNAKFGTADPGAAPYEIVRVTR